MSSSEAARVSVVIPTLNAANYLPELIPALFAQKPKAPDELIIVDSGSTDATLAIAKEHPQVRVVTLKNFSHGRARNLGVQQARGEFVVLMTQDARPQDTGWLAQLLAPFSDPEVGATFSRQYPRADANPMEEYFIFTHFPAAPAVKMTNKGSNLTFQRGIFLSNVSAAYRRDILLRYPFDETLIMSEDQQVARDIIHGGYAVYYQPKSVVVHSHNYNLRTVFRRYFDSVYSLTLIFPQHDMKESASIGFSYLGNEARHIFCHHPAWVPYYLAYTIAKTSGTLAGHWVNYMPRWLVRKLSLHAYHWN